MKSLKREEAVSKVTKPIEMGSLAEIEDGSLELTCVDGSGVLRTLRSENRPSDTAWRRRLEGCKFPVSQLGLRWISSIPGRRVPLAGCGWILFETLKTLAVGNRTEAHPVIGVRGVYRVPGFRPRWCGRNTQSSDLRTQRRHAASLSCTMHFTLILRHARQARALLVGMAVSAGVLQK